MKLSGLVPMQALGMASRSHKLVKEAEEMCPKCGKPMAQCECMGEDMDKNVANGLPQTQGDDKITLSKEVDTSKRIPSFEVNREKEISGITFL